MLSRTPIVAPVRLLLKTQADGKLRVLTISRKSSLCRPHLLFRPRLGFYLSLYSTGNVRNVG